MKSKKIIIDGVDVSKCLHLNNILFCDLGDNYPGYPTRCDENPMCYYKQLQRTTARCKVVVKQNKSLQTELKNLTELVEVAKEAPICFQCEEEPCIRKEKEKLEQECEKMRGVLNKIRNYELGQLDIDWDEYETSCRETEYSPIIDYCELGLGEAEDDK